MSNHMTESQPTSLWLQGRRGVTVSEVVRFLESKRVLTAPMTREWTESEVVVDNIADLPNARRGSLCWLSKRRFETNPTLGGSFEGALLVGPRSASGAGIVPTTDPKLAFVLAANFCMGSAEQAEWINGDAAGAVPPRVASSARVADGVFLGSDVIIEEGAVVGPHTALQHVTIGKRSTIGSNCSIGGPGFGLVWSDEDSWLRFPHVGRVEIEADVQIGNNTCIDRGALGDTRIRTGARIDNLVHIAHNADIGTNALVI